jgi:alkylation response protein AidB-like acyl-CoA dehydrogenase
MNRRHFEPVHLEFRDRFRSFVQNEIVPNNVSWREAGIVDRTMFQKAGKAGFLGLQMPKCYGGQETSDFRFNQILAEESELAGVAAAGSGIGLHNDMALPYLIRYCTETQKKKWFPGLCSGDLIGAIAITEPAAGSDIAGIATTAVRRGDVFVVNGAKTLIGNGINSDVIVVVVRSADTTRHDGISLLVVERDAPGFRRGRNLNKIGRQAQDTAELLFNDAEIPAGNLLGEEGSGFQHLMQNLPLERMNITASAVAGARYAYNLTLEYVRKRKAFGKSIGAFQNTRFRMAEMATEIEIAEVFVDRCFDELNLGTLAPSDAAMAKWWCTELQKRINDTALQLHGGHGYLEDLPISWAWRDGRITSIYGGTTEIMKEIVGRSLGL